MERGDLSGVAKRVHGVHTASPVFSYPLERFTFLCLCVSVHVVYVYVAKPKALCVHRVELLLD